MTSRKMNVCAVTIAGCLMLGTAVTSVAEEPAKPAAGGEAAAPAMTPAEQQFAARMNNVLMVGGSTTDGGAPAADKYQIVSVRKLKDDNWLFSARMKIGGQELVVPMVIPVKWAGDTPVMSVTDLGLPGMGTYTARVVIYGDQYAGTWQANGGKPHGGHLWGKIVPAPATQPAETKPAK